MPDKHEKPFEVWFDGFFAMPPNVWDDFAMAKQIELHSEIAQLEAQIDSLRAK